MLAHRQGGLFNASDLGRSLGVSSQSINRYVDLLVDLLLVRRLLPYHANVGKRLVKSPKLYIRDSGLLHVLLGIVEVPDLYGHPVFGSSFEGWVIENILSVLPWRTQAFFYRTASGAEIDLVLEHGNGEKWAIEIKASLDPKPRKGFYQGVQDLGTTRNLVIYAGTEGYLLEEGIEVMSVGAVMGVLKEYK
jgi:uncharacterized protein